MLTVRTVPKQRPQKQEIDHKSIKNTRGKAKGQEMVNRLPFHISFFFYLYLLLSLSSFGKALNALLCVFMAVATKTA